MPPQTPDILALEPADFVLAFLLAFVLLYLLPRHALHYAGIVPRAPVPPPRAGQARGGSRPASTPRRPPATTETPPSRPATRSTTRKSRGE